MTVNRDKAGRFIAGNKSGGRPKIPEDVKEAIRAACPEAVQYLIELMRNPKEKTAYRLDAAKTLLDRGYGKPEMMSKVELSTKEDTQIIFRWMNEDTNNNITVSAENDAAGNTQADRDAQVQRDSSAQEIRQDGMHDKSLNPSGIAG